MISTTPLVELIPTRWQAGDAANSFWISCYQVVFGDPDDLGEQGNAVVDLGDAMVLVVNGSPLYRNNPTMKIQSSTSDHQLHLAPLEFEQGTLPEGLYLRVILPYDNVTAPGDAVDAQARVEELVGLATLQLGRNALFVHCFDNVMSFAKNEISASTAAFKAPEGRLPGISPAALAEFGDAYAALRGLGDPDRARLSLGFRWYADSFSKQNIDALLSIWFALEAVGMTGTNVRDLHMRLASAYGTMESEATAVFQLGKIAGYRSEIVHDGARPAVHVGLVTYLQAVFGDIVRALLGLDCWNMAAQALTFQHEGPEEWFPNYRRPPGSAAPVSAR